MIIRGRVWKYGDNVDTDAIIPARYLNMFTKEELAAHCMEDATPLGGDNVVFNEAVRPGDIIVGGSNFGCGSSREHAPVAIKASGISCVVAESFARIFFRNSLNIGLPILECPEAARAAAFGQTLEVDLTNGSVRNVDLGMEYQATKYPPFMLELIEAGGLIEYTRRKLEGEPA